MSSIVFRYLKGYGTVDAKTSSLLLQRAEIELMNKICKEVDFG